MAWSKESRHKRGYGSSWSKLVPQIMRRDKGMCQCEQCQGIKYVAHEVHHIISKAKAKELNMTKAQTDEPSNLQAVNRMCHKRITLAEQGKTLKPQIIIGIDGYPIGQKTA